MTYTEAYQPTRLTMSNTRHIHVLSLHHDPLVRAGIATSLRQHVGFDVFEAPHVFPRAANEACPMDVVIADYHQAMRLLQAEVAEGPLASARILVLTSNDREADIRRAMEAGIAGYLLLGGPVSELVDGVRSLANGGRYLGHTVAQRMADSLARASLTSREVDVLRQLVAGASNKLIARHLGIEVGTVKSHMNGILTKLNASSRTHAAAIAINRGLVEEQAAPSTEPRVGRLLLA